MWLYWWNLSRVYQQVGWQASGRLRETWLFLHNNVCRLSIRYTFISDYVEWWLKWPKKSMKSVATTHSAFGFLKKCTGAMMMRTRASKYAPMKKFYLLQCLIDPFIFVNLVLIILICFYIEYLTKWGLFFCGFFVCLARRLRGHDPLYTLAQKFSIFPFGMRECVP